MYCAGKKLTNTSPEVAAERVFGMCMVHSQRWPNKKRRVKRGVGTGEKEPKGFVAALPVFASEGQPVCYIYVPVAPVV